jgi:hypothetical protein
MKQVSYSRQFCGVASHVASSFFDSTEAFIGPTQESDRRRT